MPFKDKEKRRKYNKKYYQEHSEDRRRNDLKIKEEVLTHYGGGKLACVCCGESHIEFLSIDHIAGGGEKHRRKIKTMAGCKFYMWLRKNEFPLGYRTLCFNCNMAHGIFGYCPHHFQ